jgi:hypothetical protein
MHYNKELDFDLYEVTNRQVILESSDTQEMIDEVNRIQNLHGFKIRAMYSTIERIVENFNCYYTNKAECFNYWFPKILCELFEVEEFNSDKKYIINKTDEFGINWIYDVHRLNSVEEFVSPAHAHWQTKWRNKFHPGWGRTSLVAFNKGHMQVKAALTDYSGRWSHLPLFTDELENNEDLFYSGIRFYKFDQPYYEFRELKEGFGHRWRLDFPVEVKYVDQVLYFDDIPILTIGDEITFCEYTGGLFKGDDKRIFYRNMQEFKNGIEKRT